MHILLLVYTHCWEPIELVGSSGILSQQLILKVYNLTLCDGHKLMAIFILVTLVLVLLELMQ
jgi:hypothetical protein